MSHLSDDLLIATDGETEHRFAAVIAPAVGGMILGLADQPCTTLKEAGLGIEQPTSYLMITPDSKIVLLSPLFVPTRSPSLGIKTLIIEELGAEAAQIELDGSVNHSRIYQYLMHDTVSNGSKCFGSASILLNHCRVASALIRVMLVQAAAKKWRVAADEINIKGGRVSHISGKIETLGSLAALATTLEMPRTVVLKDLSDWAQLDRSKLELAMPIVESDIPDLKKYHESA